MNEMRKLMEAVREIDHPSQEHRHEMEMEEIVELGKKHGYDERDMWRVVLGAHDRNKAIPTALELRTEDGRVLGKYDSVQQVPHSVKDPETGEKVVATVDNLHVVFRTTPEQVNSLIKDYEENNIKMHKEREATYAFDDWLDKWPGESVEEGFRHREDSIPQQIASLLAQNKRVLSKLPGAYGEVVEVDPDGYVTAVDHGGRRFTMRVADDPRLDLQGNLDHYALMVNPAAAPKSDIMKQTADELGLPHRDLAMTEMNEGWPQEETYSEMVEYWKQSLSSSIVSKGVFKELYTAAGEDIDELNAAIEDQAESIADSYHGSGEGIGTSDVNHFIASIGRSLGVDDIFGWNKRKGVEEEDHYRSHHPKYKGDDWSKDDHKRFLDKMEKRGLKKATRGPLKSDEEMERDKTNRYAKYNKAMRGRKGLGEDSDDYDEFDEPFVPDEIHAKIVADMAKVMPGYEPGAYGPGDRNNQYRVLAWNPETDQEKDMMFNLDTMSLEGSEDHFMLDNPFESLNEDSGHSIFDILDDADVYHFVDDLEYGQWDTSSSYAHALENYYYDEIPHDIKTGDYGDSSEWIKDRVMQDYGDEIDAVVQKMSREQIQAIRKNAGLSEDSGHSIFDILDDADVYHFVDDLEYGRWDDSSSYAHALEAYYYDDIPYDVRTGDYGDVGEWIKDRVMQDYGDEIDAVAQKMSREQIQAIRKNAGLSEAKGNVVEVPFKLRGSSPTDTRGATSEQAEDFINGLGIDDEVSHDVVDPETGELLFQTGTTKRKEMKKGAHFKLNHDDFTAGAKLRQPVMHGGFDKDFDKKQSSAWEVLNDLRNSDFYNVVWKNAAELVGSPADLGAEGDDWGDLDYDVDMEVPVAIKRKDGQRFDEDDHDNFREIVRATKNASTMGNFGISYAGTSNKGTVARFVPSFM